MDASLSGMSLDELEAFDLRLLPQLSCVGAMGRAKARLLDELFESKAALFNDANELTGWQQRSIFPFNFNDSELVPFMDEAVKHLIANPVAPLPMNWGSTSGVLGMEQRYLDLNFLHRRPSLDPTFLHTIEAVNFW
ncbi:hypothetical protein CYMTET_48487 [Cymbomonas tetramitiformis]|uniref:Uncharacterized protein n=1 Tax=Cymbomonas tetramitiformis TaxID=36881 RepID=A0AAE0BTT3_9CHLO|nr:hypothetical protein CYMTET_48487 [Cymbomonas tetramitiformis]